MRAFTLESFGAQPGRRNDIPEPHVGDNELLVRVRASSVNPVDVLIAAGALKDMAEHEFPVTLGRDFAGLVERIGAEVGRYRVGDEVFGFVLHANPTVRDGSWAELITVPEDNLVAAKPPGVDFADAGPRRSRRSPRSPRSTRSRLPGARTCSWSAPPAASEASSSSSPRRRART